MTEKVEFVSKASKALQDACQEAQKTLALLRHPPNFLPLARGLIFYTAWKGGIGIGIEHGHGFIISRLPYSIDSPSAGTAWSPPCFLTVHGLEVGCLAGASRIMTVCGIMDESRLETFQRGQCLALEAGADIVMCPPTGGTQALQEPLSSSFYTASVTDAGLMVELSLAGHVFRVDKTKNAMVYGEPHVTAGMILGGEIAAPGEFEPLFVDLSHASRDAFVAAFEPSNLGESAEG